MLVDTGDADDALLDVNDNGEPINGYTVNSGACIKLRNNYNIFDLKLSERKAGSSSYDRGSAVTCIPTDVIPDGLNEEDNFHQD